MSGLLYRVPMGHPEARRLCSSRRPPRLLMTRLPYFWFNQRIFSSFLSLIFSAWALSQLSCNLSFNRAFSQLHLISSTTIDGKRPSLHYKKLMGTVSTFAINFSVLFSFIWRSVADTGVEREKAQPTKLREWRQSEAVLAENGVRHMLYMYLSKYISYKHAITPYSGHKR